MSMKQKRGKSLAEQVADLDDPAPKDFDPEDPNDHGASSDEGESREDNSDGAAGREHYQVVGKSKLRKPTAVELGREYAGSRVNRNAIYEDESENDPFRSPRSRGSDESGEGSESGPSSEEEASDNEEGFHESESDIEAPGRAQPRRSKSHKGEANGVPEADVEMDDQGSDEEFESDDEGEEEYQSDNESESDNHEEEDDEVKDTRKSPRQSGSGDREELRRLMASDQKTVTASMFEAAKADANKGLAVKQQRKAFDALLNTRIKLQKGLSMASSIPSEKEDLELADEEFVKSAETAALTLWNTLENLRQALADAPSGQTSSSPKRKRIPEPTSTTSSSDIWAHMRRFEAQSSAQRRAVLDKWSRKSRGSKAVLPNSRGKLLNKGNDQQALTTVLDAHVASEVDVQRSSKRAKTSENSIENGDNLREASAPTAGASTSAYDDTTFYHALLRDLVEQRMSSANGGMADDLHVQLPARLNINPVSGMRKDKVKRTVDTKASKGRKMRYTVHEKLQNFMAPEDRGLWGDRARQEFFASLLGKSASAELGEESQEDEDPDNGTRSDEDDDVDMEEGGLRLFRS